jgi:hypothetical protein
MNTYHGKCFCGTVEFTVSGEMVAQGYCHCTSCRTWSAGPVNAFTLWPPGSVRVTRGEDQILTFNKSELSFRKTCKVCGGHLYTDHPVWKVIDVYAAILDGFKHEPKLHVNYQESVLPVKDGLPKFKDMPADMGGSGVTLAE